MTHADTSVRPMRVLYLSWRDRDHPEAGGAEKFLERTAGVLARAGHDVTIHSADFPGAAREEWHEQVRVVRAGGRFGCYVRGLGHLLRRGRDYDVVIDSQNGVPFWSPIVARMPVLNLVHHVHKDQWASIFGPRLGRFGWLLESRLAPFVYRRSPYLTVSQATRTELADLGIDPSRVRVVYSGNDIPPDLDRYARVERAARPTITVLGRLVPHKHNEIAIDVVGRLRDRFPGLHLDIVGSGYWEADLRTYAERAGLAAEVTFHGFVSEERKHELLAESWVVVMPSHKEGWGLTIVEAGLHATPSVAFAHAGGVTESVVDGETGLLARDVAELTSHVATLLEDRPLRDKYGDNARVHALSFDWERTGRELELVLREIVG